MNLIAICSFLVILYEISSFTISHTPVSTCKSYWVSLGQNFGKSMYWSKVLGVCSLFLYSGATTNRGTETCPLAAEKLENLYGGSTCNLCGV